MSPLLRDLLIRIAVPFVAVAAVGFWFATKLIAIPGLQTFKVLNIVSISFDLVAVALLSHFLSNNPRYHAFVIGPVAENIIGVLVAIPVGMIVCVNFGPDGPSRELVESITYSVGAYIMAAAISFIGNFVIAGEESVAGRFAPDVRANLLGLFFLVGGLVIQLIAAVQDMYSK